MKVTIIETRTIEVEAESIEQAREMWEENHPDTMTEVTDITGVEFHESTDTD